ncbi:hypothetical protein NAMH_1427 [Nautilia profundicola AmH]|uniref:Tetratricopeptide repeat domain protein n=2 Tax=Nautilia TaxID=191291 RepID=B9L631_NAUPA|nr:hypothetical protein NAMH_1427 [Nautilia profundicola AmH]
MAFVVIFIIFLLAAFPRNTLYTMIKNDNSETAVKYLQNILKFYPSSKLEYILAEKYINLGEFKKAEQLLKKQKDSYQKFYYEYLIAKRKYFNKKSGISEIKKFLYTLFEYAKKDKQFEYIYKEAKSFNLLDLEFETLKHLHYTDELINVALALKKYKTALRYLESEVNKKFNENYFIKMEEVLLYLKENTLANLYARQFYKKIKTKKGFDTLLRVGLLTKNTKLIRFSVDRSENKELKLQAYINLKRYKDAVKILKNTDNYYLLAEVYLWNKEYDKALEYFIKDGVKKNIKIVIPLAMYLKKESLLLNIFEDKVKRGNLKYIKELTYTYINNAQFERGIKFYKKLYQRTKKDLFLVELFKIYYALGDDEKVLKLADEFRRIPLDVAFYVSNIYISDMNYKKAYEVMKKIKSDTYQYYSRMYYLSDKLNLIQDKIKWLKHMNEIKKEPQTIYELYLSYLNENNIKKAYDVLEKNYMYSNALLFEYLKYTYKNKNYKAILSLNIKNKPEFYYEFLVKVYNDLHKYEKLDKLYQRLIYKYPKFRNDYFWFLLDRKDKRIANYLNQIKDENILLGAYLLLNKKYEAMKLLKKQLKKQNNINLLIQYYYLTNDEKIKFMLFRRIDKLITRNKKILKNQTYRDFYFYNLLHYGSYYKIKKILNYLKSHNLNYKKYYALYLDYMRAYEKLRRFER